MATPLKPACDAEKACVVAAVALEAVEVSLFISDKHPCGSAAMPGTSLNVFDLKFAADACGVVVDSDISDGATSSCDGIGEDLKAVAKPPFGQV